MTNLQAIKSDILSLRGANVRIFGQPTTLSSEVDETTIDIIDVLNHIEGHELTEFEYEVENYDEEENEYSYTIEEWETMDEYLEWLENMGELKEIGSDNSYNWGSPVSNDFQYTLYHNTINDTYLVKLRVHRFGDPRGNYTNECLLQFFGENNFFEALNECVKTIEINGYNVEVDIFRDTMTVYDQEWNEIRTITDLDELNEEEGEED